MFLFDVLNSWPIAFSIFLTMLLHRWRWQFNRFEARSSRFLPSSNLLILSHVHFPLSNFLFFFSRRFAFGAPASRHPVLFRLFLRPTKRRHPSYEKRGRTGIWTANLWSGNLLCWPVDHATPHFTSYSMAWNHMLARTRNTDRMERYTPPRGGAFRKRGLRTTILPPPPTSPHTWLIKVLVTKLLVTLAASFWNDAAKILPFKFFSLILTLHRLQGPD